MSLFFPVAHVSWHSRLLPGERCCFPPWLKAPFPPMQHVSEPVTPVPVWECCCSSPREQPPPKRIQWPFPFLPLTHSLKQQTMMNPIYQWSHHHSSRTISLLQPRLPLSPHPQLWRTLGTCPPLKPRPGSPSTDLAQSLHTRKDAEPTPAPTGQPWLLAPTRIQ